MSTRSTARAGELSAKVGDVSGRLQAPAGGNVLNKLSWGKGDIEKGFAEADLVLEHTFRMPIHHQGYLEPQSFLVKIDDDGTVNAWASTKGPFGSRADQ